MGRLLNSATVAVVLCLMERQATAVVALHDSLASMVTLSNVQLPKDQNGEPIITGEADVLYYDKAYYFYFNNWGSCPGVNCCDSKAGCASCCFDHPPHPMQPCSNPYGLNHTIQVYKTVDLVTWTNMGVALPLSARHAGIEFRPHVVFNPKTKLFLMWYEDRGPGESGYAIAQSKTPEGPFKTTHVNVNPGGHDKIGDYDIFVDDDGKAYHVRTGFIIVELDENYTAGTNRTGTFTSPKPSEGPVMFKRDGKYYILVGTGCCACIGGSTIYVFVGDSPLGPYKYQGDVGSNPTPFDPHSPNNYVTKAQASAVFVVNKGTSAETLVWMGNQWNSGLSQTPPGPRNHDLLYWYPMQFTANGSVVQFEYEKEVQVPKPNY